MGQTIGRVETQKLSENEFSFEWHFCKVNFDFAYRSPTYGFTCQEFSGCYLEMKPNVIYRTLTFYLCGCKKRNGTKISTSAVLVDGNAILYKSNQYDACLDIEPSMKIFEIHLSDPILSSCFNYILNLQMKLLVATLSSSILDENVLFHNIPNKAIPGTSFKKVSTSMKSLEYNTAPFTTLNEVSTSTSDLEYNSDSPTVSSEGPINTEHSECKKASSFTKTTPNYKYTKELVEDLGILYTSGNMCDLEIRIGEDVLCSHKLILCARSPVFKAMMESNCSESISNSVTFTDCPALPFKKFLKYLYTGEIEDSTLDIVMSLYSLGHKYSVKALPEACSDILKNKLSLESVDTVANIICNVLQLAECHNDRELHDISADFIVNHFPVVSKKQNWKDLVKSNIELASKILTLVATGLREVKK